MKIYTDLKRLNSHKTFLKMNSTIRNFLDEAGYQEVDVPLLSPVLIPETHLEVFETEYRYFSDREKLYLIPAQELFLKRLIAFGVGNCYTLGKTFRNHERLSDLHAGEFTMLEYYRIEAGYLEMGEELLKLFTRICQTLYGRNYLLYKGKKIEFGSWEKMSVAEAFEKYANISSEELFDHMKFISIAAKKGYNVNGATYEELFSQIYGHELEPFLGKSGRPTLLYDYPLEFAATAKPNKDGRTAARFDIYIEGIEIGNCYSENTDPKQIKERFEKQQARRRELGKIDYPIDKGFVEALQYGLTECSGVTIGIDRLGMLCADIESIADLRLIDIR